MFGRIIVMRVVDYYGLLYPHVTICTISYYVSRAYCLCVGV
jgi:hypothetical protein